jgi:hypothetical protein
MSKLVSLSLRWVGACAALALVAGWNNASRADVAYGYAQQQVSNIVVTGTGIAAATPTGTSTNASAAINGSGVATNNPTDTLQAYVGAAPAAPQNSYVKYGTTGGGTQAGDFTRGDAIVTGTNLFTGAAGNSVAESQVSSPASGLATGSGSWNVSGSFTAPTTTTVNVAYSYINDVIAQVIGSGSASASFKVTITIKDQHGHSVDATPVELNAALSAPPNGTELISSGTGSAALSLAGFTAGDVYGISITGTSLSSAIVTAVPEPGPMVLAGLGGVIAMGFGAFRARNRKV